MSRKVDECKPLPLRIDVSDAVLVRPTAVLLRPTAADVVAPLPIRPWPLFPASAPIELGPPKLPRGPPRPPPPPLPRPVPASAAAAARAPNPYECAWI